MHIKLALLPGDGIGPAVVDGALQVLEAVAGHQGLQIDANSWPIGWAGIEDSGDPLPTQTLAACLDADAILLGALGDPRADDRAPAERPVSGLIRLRKELGCFANLRPVRVTEGLLPYSPLRPQVVRGVDLVVVRELTGGAYYGEPRGSDAEGANAWNTMRYSAEEVRRIARVAFDLARSRQRRVTSVDKANVLEVSRLWRTVVDEVSGEFPDVELEHMLVDRAAMEIVKRPTSFDVIVTQNLFGDILSDEGAALPGSLGLLGSASLGGVTDLYEPVHGSAPDITSSGLANPAGTIASLALLLRHTFDLTAEADAVDWGLSEAFSRGLRTRDLVLAVEDSDVDVWPEPIGCEAFAGAVAGLAAARLR